jgi:hypothetical protein
MKLTIQNLKPRNPFVVASMRRNAGSHRRGAASQRQQHRRDLTRELAQARQRP